MHSQKKTQTYDQVPLILVPITNAVAAIPGLFLLDDLFQYLYAKHPVYSRFTSHFVRSESLEFAL